MTNANWHTELKNEVMRDPEARTEYEAFKLQLELAHSLKNARQQLNMTQEEVAKKMDTTKTVIARFEAAGGRNKHSPSLLTIIKFAAALGYDVQFNIVPHAMHKHKI